MTIKEIFQINSLLNKIKLDHSEDEDSKNNCMYVPGGCEQVVEEIPENEWNQEYELIYLSYVLEK
jgi:hypothetical protein